MFKRAMDKALQPNTSSANHTSGVVKRTSSGLAKAIGNDGSGFQENVFFEEGDFDSDVDLDNPSSSQPKPKKTTASLYPRLPSPKPTTVTKYPNLQNANIHTQASATSTTQHVPSSNPMQLPWSSSPDWHNQTPPGGRRLGPSFLADSVSLLPHPPEAQQQTVAPIEQPAASPVRPTKRRTLPWLRGLDDEDASSSAQPPKDNAAASTPQAKNAASSYSWNTTASAFKEQQKQFRKANKKPPARADPDDDGAVALAVPKKKQKGIPRLSLSMEQQKVLDIVVEQGKSVFFTGSAGTGKSVLLREIISVLRNKFARESDRVAITASTGLAACNIGGVTLHSFAGIGLGKEEVPELVKKIKRNQKARHRWMRTKVLIIDEVSMVDGELFDKLEAIARQIRSNGRPFGGIQLIITGDFFQLPPVPDGGSGRVSKFSFDAQSWGAAIERTIALHQVFRQRDPQFASMLNEMREGKLTQSSVNSFQKLHRSLQFTDDLTATELFPTRSEVEAANNARMLSLGGNLVTYEAKDGGTIVDKVARDKLLQNCMAPEKLDLKVGAQVMLIKNIDEMLVNGSLGYVKGFMNEQMFDSYNADEDAYHAAQHNEDDELNPKEQKLKRHLQLLQASTSQAWPLVRFTLADGTTRDLLCNRETWKVELPNGEIQASRAQVPLILAWALSIHKAQGQTLERVKVDLGKVFEKGQAYVALSRATTMDGLQVLRFDPKKVLAHERVRSFYAGLSSASQYDSVN